MPAEIMHDPAHKNLKLSMAIRKTGEAWEAITNSFWVQRAIWSIRLDQMILVSSTRIVMFEYTPVLGRPISYSWYIS